MAPIDQSSEPAGQAAWNQAFDRLQNFLNTFSLSDRPMAAQLALKIFDQARELHRQDSSRDPTTLVMEQTHKSLTEWLAANLDERDKSPSQVFSAGCIALFLSRIDEKSPHSFLADPLPDDLRQSLRQTLLVTGPDLKVSSMTPRHLDYGPMLNLARQTWHRWSSREILVALLFWTGVYFFFYWWLSDLL